MSRRDARRPFGGEVDASGSELAEGRYRVGEELARGGMGIVHRGHDAALDRDVALKLLRPELVHQGEMRRRFLREARIHARLQHPGVAPVYCVGQDAAQRPWIAMRLVGGRTLAEELAQRDPARRGDDRTALLAVVEQIARTLAWAHRHEIVHRDLKPENVMVGTFGEVQVMDWGLAKGVGEAPDEGAHDQVDPLDTSSRISMVGEVLGTPAYMSPEQARGDPDAIDVRADVFSLGALLCEVLTGEPPYHGRGAPVVLQAYRGELEPAYARLVESGADAELLRLTRSCLARERAERPADAGAVALALAELRATATRRARRAAVVAAEERTHAREASRSRKLSVAILAVVVGILVVGVGGAQLMRTRREARHATALAEVRVALDEALSAEAAGRLDAATSSLRRASSVADAAGLAEAQREDLALRLQRLEGLARDQARRAELGARVIALADAVADYELEAALGLPPAPSLPELLAQHDLAPPEPAFVEALRRFAAGEAVARAIALGLARGIGGDAELELARALDPHPLRSRQRLALRGGDVADLARLAVSARAMAPAPGSALVWATGLAGSADPAAREAALQLARSAASAHPGSAQAHLARLVALEALGEESAQAWSERAATCEVLRALRPHSEELTRRHTFALARLEELAPR